MHRGLQILGGRGRTDVRIAQEGEAERLRLGNRRPREQRDREDRNPQRQAGNGPQLNGKGHRTSGEMLL